MIKEWNKEVIYALRSGKLVAVVAGFLFFALMSPVMLKVVLPAVMLNRGVPYEELTSLTRMTQIGSIQLYMNDVFEMGTILISFALCGLIAQEIKEETLVLPLCSGKSLKNILGAKAVVFGLILWALPVVALFFNYLYSGFLFGFELEMGKVLGSGILQGVYLQFLLCNVLFWGAVLKKPVSAGFATMLVAYGFHFTGGLLDVHRWLPSGLLLHAQDFGGVVSSPLLIPLLVTGVLCAGLFTAALWRLQGLEWNEG